jgi:ketosteroid isomerase-like protein
MSQENVDVMREWIDAFNRGGLEESMRFLDPEIEWTTTSQYLEAGTYQGHEGVRQWIRRATAGWEDPRLEAERITDAAGRVVAPLRATARATQTRTPGEVKFTVLAEVRGGVIVRVRNYANEAEALEAAGGPPG